jgi:hypothetical protein
MENIFVISGIISIIFMLFKFFEMRVIDKESKPLKVLIRDAIVVYFSIIIGNFIYGQLNYGINKIEGGAKGTPVFIDNPEF